MYNVWIYITCGIDCPTHWMFIHFILKVFWGHCRTLYVQICGEPWNAQTIIAHCVMYSVGTYSVIRVLCKFIHSLQNIQCSIFIMQHAVCSVQCLQYSLRIMKCAMCDICYAVYSNVYYAVCIVQYSLCSVQCAIFIMQCAIFIMQCAECSHQYSSNCSDQQRWARINAITTSHNEDPCHCKQT